MIRFMLTMQIVVRDGIATDLSNSTNNLPAGLNVYSHNMHYSPYETQIVN